MNNGLDIILWSLIEAYKIDKKFLDSNEITVFINYFSVKNQMKMKMHDDRMNLYSLFNNQTKLELMNYWTI